MAIYCMDSEGREQFSICEENHHIIREVNDGETYTIYYGCSVCKRVWKEEYKFAGKFDLGGNLLSEDSEYDTGINVVDDIHNMDALTMNVQIFRTEDGEQFLLAHLAPVEVTFAVVEELTVELDDVGAVVCVVFVQMLDSKLQTVVDHS